MKCRAPLKRWTLIRRESDAAVAWNLRFQISKPKSQLPDPNLRSQIADAISQIPNLRSWDCVGLILNRGLEREEVKG